MNSYHVHEEEEEEDKDEEEEKTKGHRKWSTAKHTDYINSVSVGAIEKCARACIIVCVHIWVRTNSTQFLT